MISEAQAFQLDEYQQSLLLKDPKVTPALIQSLEQAIKQSLLEKLKLAILRGLDSTTQPTHSASFSTANFQGRREKSVRLTLEYCKQYSHARCRVVFMYMYYDAHENNVCTSLEQCLFRYPPILKSKICIYRALVLEAYLADRDQGSQQVYICVCVYEYKYTLLSRAKFSFLCTVPGQHPQQPIQVLDSNGFNNSLAYQCKHLLLRGTPNLGPASLSYPLPPVSSYNNGFYTTPIGWDTRRRRRRRRRAVWQRLYRNRCACLRH